LIIVAADNRGSKLARLKVSSFLAAVNRHDGSIVWRIHRPQEHSFSSPIVAEVAGKHQLLLGGPSLIASYNPLSGDLFWSCESGASRTANTLAFSDNTVFSSATQTNSEVIAIRADGNGKVKSSHVVWEEKRGAGDVPSPLWYGGFLYVLNDRGVLTCFASETGKILWRKRLPGRYSSSPVIGGDHLFVTNEHGTTYVLTLGDNSELVQENELQEPVFASVVFTGQLTLIRSSNHLWCLQHNQTVSEQPEL
jgi:outer membrane protein assembly factor BamB